MAYSNFTLETVQKTFQLDTVRSVGIFSEIEPSNLQAHISRRD